MSGKVIAFPNRPRHETSQVNKTRPLSERAAAIRQAAKNKRMLTRATERGIVARNLYRILLDFERDSGISRVEVLRAVGLGNPEVESTKRLHYYTLPGELEEGGRKRREKKLAKSAARYIRFVDAAAKLAKVSADEKLVELFAGTSYDAGTRELEYPAAVYDLIDKLNSMVRWVVAEAKLEHYWREVRATRGAYDVYEEAIRISGRRLSTMGDFSGGSIEHIDDIPPIPEVSLFEYREPGTLSARLKTQDEAGAWHDRGEAKIEVFREVRLAVAEVGSVPRGVFAVYTRIVATVGSLVLNAMHTDGTFTVSRPHFPKDARGRRWVPVLSADGSVEGYSPVCVEEKGRWVAAELDHGPNNNCPIPSRAPAPYDGFIGPGEPWWVILVPIVDTAVFGYCSMCAGNDEPRGPLFHMPREFSSTPWPIGSLGEAIEANLLYADQGRLDDLLLADARAKVEILARYRAAAAEKRSSAEVAVYKKWKNKGNENELSD
ncbi:MAG: hypothetical protein H3C38_00015 [Rhodospirillales bacterium]|nr:hypothetical protein [Rhodospirillales bacterium]